MLSIWNLESSTLWCKSLGRHPTKKEERKKRCQIRQMKDSNRTTLTEQRKRIHKNDREKREKKKFIWNNNRCSDKHFKNLGKYVIESFKRLIHRVPYCIHRSDRLLLFWRCIKLPHKRKVCVYNVKCFILTVLFDYIVAIVMLFIDNQLDRVWHCARNESGINFNMCSHIHMVTLLPMW